MHTNLLLASTEGRLFTGQEHSNQNLAGRVGSGQELLRTLITSRNGSGQFFFQISRAPARVL